MATKPNLTNPLSYLPRDLVLRAIRVDEMPSGLLRLAPVALAHARQQRHVALVAVAVGLLAGGGGLRRDVEDERQVGLRQIALRVGQPRGVEAL